MNRVAMIFLVLAVTGGCVTVVPEPVSNDNANWPPRGPAAPASAWQPPSSPGAWSKPMPSTASIVTSASTVGGPNAPRAWANQPLSTTTAQRNTTPGSSTPSATAAKPSLAQSTANKSDNALVKASYTVEKRTNESASSTSAPTKSVSAKTSPESVAQPTENKASPINLGVLRLINSKRLTFHYQIKDAASTDVSQVEMWGTTDMRNWKKIDVVKRSPTSLAVDVKEEGLYGFTMFARNKDESAKVLGPLPGAPPQVWVAVDLTKPVVQLLGAELNVLTQSPALVIRWNAQDRNFGPRPITLLYAERPEGPWLPIAANVENSGHYEWTMPPHVPASLYVRVQAADMMGNLGLAQTTALYIPGRPSLGVVRGEPTRAEPRCLGNTAPLPLYEPNLRAATASAPSPAVSILSVDND
ncbi:MAG: hypothetical protein ACYC3I_03280 [Gemmataceae bacterium]